MGRAGLHNRIGRYGAALLRRSRRLVAFLNLRIGALGWAWFAIAGGLAALRTLGAITPIHGAWDLAQIAVPYALMILAPVAGYRLAEAAFPAGAVYARPRFSLPWPGRWRRLSAVEARGHPAFGPAGFMVSLVIGMMLNVGMRTLEFLWGVPAMNHHAPEWGQLLFLAMATDAVVMNFFYMVCFVMALRSVPLFPRMLLFAWLIDILIQLSIARAMGPLALPAAVAGPLEVVLEGNVRKVLISALVWVPYLLLSVRANVTYRHRSPAPDEDGGGEGGL